MHYDYAWQKSFEAVTCLTGEGTLDARLGSAAQSLALLPTEVLPADTQAQALVAHRAFNHWPHPHPYGVAVGLLAVLPDVRKRELARKVVVLYDAVCRLAGAEEAGAPVSPPPATPVELRSDDLWEFLYWGTSTQSPAAEQAAYVEYAQHYLPNFPGEVLLEWLGRHGYDQMKRWAHLNLKKLEFERVEWTRDQVAALQAMPGSEGYMTVAKGSQGASALERQADWVGQQVATTGTWPHPIVVFESTAAHKGPQGAVPKGFILVEGHRRVAALLNAPEPRLKPNHVAWVARESPAGNGLS